MQKHARLTLTLLAAGSLVAGPFLPAARAERADIESSSELKKLPASTEDLRVNNLKDKDFVLLSRFKKLASLQIADSKDELSDDALAEVAKLQTLRELSLSYARGFTDEGLEHVSKLGALETLDLSGCKGVTDAGLAHLKKLRRLKRLEMSGLPLVTDAGLAALSGLPELAKLRIWANDELGDTGLAHLAKLPSLTEIFYGQTKVTDAGLTSIARVHALTRLELGSPSITDAGLAQIAKLSKLKVLRLEDCGRVTDAGLVHLAKLKRLNELNIGGTSVAGPGLRQLASLTLLENLFIANSKITDSSVTALLELKQVRDLIIGSDLSSKAVPTLSKLTWLAALRVFGDKISDKDVAKLKAAMPTTVVEKY